MLTPLSVGGRASGSHSPLGTDQHFAACLVGVTRPSLKGQINLPLPLVNRYAVWDFLPQRGLLTLVTCTCDMDYSQGDTGING